MYRGQEERYAKEVHEMAGIDDQKSVSILLDKQTNTAVSNESAEIVRMFGTTMKDYATHDVDLFPEDKAKPIEEFNDWIYTDVANGSYKTAFVSSNQEV